jgi:ELWxxDGT repeat protein
MVEDINPGSADDPPNPDSSNPFRLTDAGGTLFLYAEDGTDEELWKSDGTGATKIDINPTGNSSPEDLMSFNGTLFFSADDGMNGIELWKSGGGPVGTNPGDTQMVADIAPGSEDSYPDGMTDLNGTLFFQADDPGSAMPHGTELWKSSGAGASLVADIRPGPLSSNPFPFRNVNGTLLFAADDGAHGSELWQSDGTAAGTRLAADLNPGAASSQPGNLTNGNGILFFAPTLPGSGREPWKATLSVEGPAPVVTPPAPPKKKCKKGRKLKKGKCVKKKRKKK